MFSLLMYSQSVLPPASISQFDGLETSVNIVVLEGTACKREGGSPL